MGLPKTACAGCHPAATTALDFSVENAVANIRENKLELLLSDEPCNNLTC